MKHEKQVAEAVKRMKKLGLMPQIVVEFENEGIVQYSEPTPIGGILYWLSNEPEWREKVRVFEDEYHSLVYHVIHSYTRYGEQLSFLYVSDAEEEWEMDNIAIEDKYPFAYVENLDCPEFSEFGTIAVDERAGGLVRIG